MTELLHPNLAKIAATYDQICERLARGELTPAKARAEIAQLEARDDEGVRWSLHPDTGTWVRKTAFGDVEFDASPPTHGFAGFDAFDLSPNTTAFNPRDRLTYQRVVDSQPSPGSLYGATRHASPTPSPREMAPRRARGLAVKAAAAVAVVLAAFLAVKAATGEQDDGAPTPTPQVVQPADH